MKYWSLFIFLSLHAVLSAQNWLPLVPSDEYQFRNSDSLLISNVIRVDSQTLLPNGDRLFFLNLIVTDCDTCITHPAKLGNQGQFLQKRALLRPDGRWLFSGKNTFLLAPAASMGESWLMDTAQNLVATVAQLGTQTIFNQPDSVKIIALSNGRQIILSKDHGILQFPDYYTIANYDLMGIPSRNLGEKLPQWQDFYDFQPGDELEFERDESLEPGTPAHIYKREKRRILDRFWDNDTLVYMVENFLYTYLQWSGPPHPFFSHEIKPWRIHPHLAEPQTEGYPGQFVDPGDFVFDGMGSRLHWIIDTLYGLSQALGIVQEPYMWGGCSLFTQPDPTLETLLPCEGCGTSFHRRHSVGLGLTSYSNACFEYWDYGRLTAWIKNGDTTGVLTPDSFFLVSLRPEPLAVPVQVLSNPTQTDWQIYLPESTSELLQLVLYSVEGETLFQDFIETGSQHKTVAATVYPAGVYFLKIQGKNGLKTFRLIKEH